MRKLTLIILIAFQLSNVNAQDAWQANWITYPVSQNNTNSWYCFRKDFPLEKVPLQALAKIAIDSKYWLWINGTMVRCKWVARNSHEHL